ncbi:ankyrin repeat-containing domain protein [Trichoderma pleuroticola]
MSLGFEVDFLAVIGLVNQVRKSFAGAPEQFRAISDDVRGFSIILQDVEASCTELGPEQSQEYQSVVVGCKNLLVQLKKGLEEYASVAEAGKTGKKTAIKRVWRRLKWEPDDIRDIRSQISVKIATLRSLNDQVTSHNIAKLIRHREDTEREATLKWISDINYVAQQNDIVLRCQIGSRRWLFESEVYLEWCKRKGSLLFCPGNAGTGKTFTTAMVVESLRLANDAETLTTYMYCTYQNHTQTIEKLLCSILRVALEETDPEADETISTCKQLRLSNKIVTRQHCLSLLQDLFSRFARVNLIVDAVDELPNEVRRPLIYDLLKLHKNGVVSLFVTSRGIPEIQHLFEACEFYTSLEVRSSDEDIRNFLRGNIFQLPNFVARSQKLQDEVINSVTNASAGMFLLAELYLKSLANMISVGSLRARLSNLTIGSNAYDALYEDSMLRIGFQGPELERIAIQMLLVLTCARRPLSPQELSHALSIDETSDAFDEDMIPDMDDLVAACTGLAVLDDTSNVVHLVHKSAAEYFERTRSRWFPRANEKMAFICLQYLQIAETKPEETRGEQAPFFRYAKANWCYHSTESEKEAANDTAMGDASRANSAAESGTSPNKIVVTQLAIQQMMKEVVDVDSSIIEACHAGHHAWVEQLLVVRNYDMNIHGISQKTFISEDGSLIDSALPTKPLRDNVLLTIAAARGDHSMALLLLERGADPNIFNAMGQTPLLIAAANGFDNLVSLLLDQKLITPDLMCHYLGRLSTAFLVSIELGREGCFRMLLEKSNRRVRDSYERGAVWLAATSGHTSIISELLKWPGVEIDYTVPGFCGNPLAAAIRGEHEEAALLLLPYSKCRSCGNCGITPMHYAVRNELHDLLERLLEHDASAVDSERSIFPHGISRRNLGLLLNCEWEGTEHTTTPLMTAIYLRDAEATQILLPYANVNHGLAWRPLHEAVEWGNAEIFELLLKKEGIELDPVDEHGRTPFLLAAERGHCDIMNALIKKGGDIQFDRKDAGGHSARDYIIDHYFRCPSHVQLLASVLDMNVNGKDATGSNLLHKACRPYPRIMHESNSEFVVDLLETNTGLLVTELLKIPGVDVNLLDGKGNTPLLLAVKNQQRDVVRLLLEREDIDVLAKDEQGNDALWLASIHKPMFERLFYWPVSSLKAEIRPLGGQVPARYRADNWPEVLNTEFKQYDEAIFSMLIHDKRTNPYVRNKQKESIMAGVAMTGTENMVQRALEITNLASDLEITGPDGKSLLSLALQKNQDDDAVDLLIAHCPAAVLDKADAEGRSPLSYSVQRVTSRATRALLEAGVNTNTVDRYGTTPLSYAAQRGHPNTVCLLLAADETLINIPGHDDSTPLIQAGRRLNIPVMSVLLEVPDINILPLKSRGHSFLCHLMASHSLSESKYRSKDESEDGLERELDGVIDRIHHLFRLHVLAVRASMHSPFICAIEQCNYPSFRRVMSAYRPGTADWENYVEDRRMAFVAFMSKLQRFAILSNYFHPGLDFSQCITTTGILELLGESNYGEDCDNRDYQRLCLRALQLYVNET